MPTDYSLQVRQAVVAHLKADAGVTALVSASRIYGEVSDPDTIWPFIRLGFLISGPFEAQGWDGSEHRVTVHTFWKAEYTTDILRLNAAVIAAMQSVVVAGVGTVDLEYRSSEVVRDSDEASAYHGVNQFDMVVAG